MVLSSVDTDASSSAAIWLGWWADETAIDPSAPIGKWLGVYVVLGVGSMVGAGISSW